MRLVEQRMAALTARARPGARRARARERSRRAASGLRPLLVCLAAGVPTPASDALVRAGVAVELVHAATLVHDDVLDGSSLRRGRPTVVALVGRLHGARHRRPAVLARLRGARRRRGGRADPVSPAPLAARRRRADAARRRVERRGRARTLPGALPAEDRPSCSGPPASSARGAAAARGDALGRFGERSGSPSSCSTTSSTSPGPPERTGKPRGADLLDGTVTLPLILARAGSPLLAAAGPADRAPRRAGRQRCVMRSPRPDSLQVAKGWALEMVASAKRALPLLPERQRAALELVADGVVER